MFRISSYQIKVLLIGIVLTFILESITLAFPHLWQAYAQTPTASPTLDKAHTKMKNRLATLQKDLDKISEFSKLTDEKSKTALDLYKSTLNHAITDGPHCMSLSDSPELDVCKKLILEAYNKATEFRRLFKAYEIAQGVPLICVKADLDQGRNFKARGVLETPGPDGKLVTPNSRVFLCTGPDGTRKLRVNDGTGKYVHLIDEDLQRPELQLNNLPPRKSLQKLESILGVPDNG